MATVDSLKVILRDTLQLGERAERIDRSTKLLGGIPEFDSMALIAVLTAIEESFDLNIEDDEVTAETFETFGSLTDFIDRKLAS